jgi:hypothetical protein
MDDDHGRRGVVVKRSSTVSQQQGYQPKEKARRIVARRSSASLSFLPGVVVDHVPCHAASGGLRRECRRDG